MPHEDDEVGPLNLPSAIEISGGAVTTERQPDGHFLWFDHDAVAEMGSQHFVGTQIVRDHNTSIGARAGTVKRSGVERFDIEVPVVNPEELDDDDDREVITDDEGRPMRLVERASLVDFSGMLEEKFEGFESVARHLLALDEEDEVPHTSIMVMGESISFDAPTRRFFLDGPLRALHQGIVFQGAFKPDDGVGIEDIQPMEATAEFDVGDEHADLVADLNSSVSTVKVTANDDGGACVSVPMKASVVVANAESLAADFIEEHMDQPDLVELLAEALGMDEPIEETETDGPNEPPLNTSNEAGDTRHITINIGTDTPAVPAEADSTHNPDVTLTNGDDLDISVSDVTLPYGIEQNRLRVPRDPNGGSGEGTEGEWDSSEHATHDALADWLGLDHETWADWSDDEKRKASRAFADATDEWSDNLDDDLNLPHHFTQNDDAPDASLNGARNALSRLSQTENLHSDEDDVREHLNEHLPDDEEESLWNAYHYGALRLDEVAERVGFDICDLGLSSRTLSALVEADSLDSDTEALSTDDNLIQGSGDKPRDSGMGQPMPKDNEPDGGEPLDPNSLREELAEDLRKELAEDLRDEVVSEVKGAVTEVVSDTIEQRDRRQRLAEHKQRTARELGVSEGLFAKCETIEEVDDFAEDLAAEVRTHRGGNRVEGLQLDPSPEEEIDYAEVLQEREEGRTNWLRKMSQIDIRDGSQSVDQVQRI